MLNFVFFLLYFIFYLFIYLYKYNKKMNSFKYYLNKKLLFKIILNFLISSSLIIYLF